MIVTTPRTDQAAGSRLRAERARQGLALLALATRAGCSPTTLLAVELYGHLPRPGTCSRIAGALGVPPDAIWPADEPHASIPTIPGALGG